MCERRAVRGGAVRAVAFVGSATGAAADDDFVHAPDARFVIAAGEGDFTPRAWHLDESGLGIAGPGFALGTHAGSVVAAAADPETRWLLFTASAKGEALLWDLRESRLAYAGRRAHDRREPKTEPPLRRCGRVRVRRGGDGGDRPWRAPRLRVRQRRGRRGGRSARMSSVTYGGGGGGDFVATGASVVAWSDRVHSGHDEPLGRPRAARRRRAPMRASRVRRAVFDSHRGVRRPSRPRRRGDRGARRVALASRRRAYADKVTAARRRPRDRMWSVVRRGPRRQGVGAARRAERVRETSEMDGLVARRV